MVKLQEFKDAFKFKEQKISPKKIAWEYGQILLGTFIMAVGLVIFIAPLKLAPGGVYGIAIILHHLFGFPIGLSGITLDIPLLIIGTLWLGPKFGLKTIVGIISLSGFISLLEIFYGYELLIADSSAEFIMALCGGVLTGFGLGLIFRTRATSGGTDIIVTIISKYLRHLPLGTILIFVDSCIVLIALLVFQDWKVPIYSLFVIYVAGVVTDKVISGFPSAKAVIIVSDHYEEIRNRIMHDLDRGGTFLKGEGMYNHADKKIIYTTISRKQLPQLIYFVHEIDPKAFLSILDASSTLGEGFESLKEKALS